MSTLISTLEFLGCLTLAILFFIAFFYALFEWKFDHDDQGQLILWYTAYKADGSAERRFIILFKK